ncbi:Rgg family transcriptional regulator [Limosilactobacillus reuteri]|uniref:HTH-type transcriptional regulator Rgg C-terminal domain-containing protein n=1 Tax=Limosilactobacillus reuteri TaxID=1598 RepID=A0AB36AFR8_LIMRT|nr:Rgg/GadR/MutR family transcriptional regulator [Limosilactobacillus reuteri]MCH5379298.1 Rgg/GadR/MutR family transcriptional regulator [Limosilactobacillus reuteri]MRG84632.1 hypothetical protein [Limosilactobacillus reuteri]OCW64935.1 hypothetical protein BBP10_00705 [Limosilactobacillus reuteri]OCW65189.1 hypothetical protein BBP12_04100 [Limosilactobacillus reuteri]OCW66951.1 hypothetical protein BBP11_11015 [Limosilactobacillus reuteri]
METKDWGKTISYIRKNKNIPIKQVIGEKITRSAYSRFASGQTNTSIDNFFFFMQNLHINFEEFIYIQNKYELDKYQKLLKKAQVATHQKNIKELEKIKNRFDNYAKVTEYIEPLHLKCIITLTINKLKKEPYDKNAKQIITEYLEQCESWMHYELVLFNNAMFIFDLNLIKVMKRKVIHNLEKYQNLRSYGSESFRILINILMLFLEHSEFNEARLLIDEIDEFHLHGDMFFEKVLRMYFTGLVDFISSKGQEQALLNESLDILKSISKNEYYAVLSTYLTKMKKQYEILD